MRVSSKHGLQVFRLVELGQLEDGQAVAQPQLVPAVHEAGVLALADVLGDAQRDGRRPAFVLKRRVAQQVAEVLEQRLLAGPVLLVMPLGERLQCLRAHRLVDLTQPRGVLAGHPGGHLVDERHQEGAVPGPQVAGERVEAHRPVEVDLDVLALVHLAGGVVGRPAVENDHRTAQGQHLLDEMVHQEGLARPGLARHDGVGRGGGVEQVAGDRLAAPVDIELHRRLAAGVVAVQRQQVRRRQRRDAPRAPQHAVPGVLQVEAEGQRLQEELVAEDVLRQELQVQAPRRLRQHRDGRGDGAVGPAPQHQVHPRVQDVGVGVFHDAVEVFAQPHLLGVFVAEGGVALQVGEVSLLAQHGALIRLVGDADLRHQGQGHVGQRLPGREGFGVRRRVQAGEDAGEGARRRLLQGHDARLPGVLAGGVGVVRSEHVQAPCIVVLAGTLSSCSRIGTSGS